MAGRSRRCAREFKGAGKKAKEPSILREVVHTIKLVKTIASDFMLKTHMCEVGSLVCEVTPRTARRRTSRSLASPRFLCVYLAFGFLDVSHFWQVSTENHCTPVIASDTWFVPREQNSEKEPQEATTTASSFFSNPVRSTCKHSRPLDSCCDFIQQVMLLGLNQLE